jgi:hypothetical protein
MLECLQWSYVSYKAIKRLKVKTIPVRGSRSLRHEGGKVSRMHRPPLTPGNIHGTHFCWRVKRPCGHSSAERVMSMKNSNDTTRSQTRDLPACSAVPQPTATPRVLFHKIRDPGSLNLLYSVCPTTVRTNTAMKPCSFLRRRIVMCLVTPTAMCLILFYALTLHLGIKPVSIRLHNIKEHRFSVMLYWLLFEMHNSERLKWESWGNSVHSVH